MIKEEGATFIYDKDGELIGLIKLDEKSRKRIIYATNEGDIEFITSLMKQDETENTKTK